MERTSHMQYPLQFWQNVSVPLLALQNEPRTCSTHCSFDRMYLCRYWHCRTNLAHAVPTAVLTECICAVIGIAERTSHMQYPLQFWQNVSVPLLALLNEPRTCSTHCSFDRMYLCRYWHCSCGTGHINRLRWVVIPAVEPVVLIDSDGSSFQPWNQWY